MVRITKTNQVQHKTLKMCRRFFVQLSHFEKFSLDSELYFSSFDKSFFSSLLAVLRRDNRRNVRQSCVEIDVTSGIFPSSQFPYYNTTTIKRISLKKTYNDIICIFPRVCLSCDWLSTRIFGNTNAIILWRVL